MKRRRFLSLLLSVFAGVALTWTAGFTAAYIASSESQASNLASLTNNFFDDIETQGMDEAFETLDSLGATLEYEASGLGDSPAEGTSHPSRETVTARGVKNGYTYVVNLPMSTAALTCFYLACIGSPMLSLAFLLTSLALHRTGSVSDGRVREAIMSVAQQAGVDLSGVDISSHPDLVNATIVEGATILESKVEQLRSAQQTINLILDSLPEAFFALAQDGRVLLHNRAMFELCQTVGVTRISEVPAIKTALAELTGAGQTQTLEIEGGGRIYAVAATAFQTDQRGGELKGVAFAARDVTSERNLARAKIDFFSYASHELKSPLTSIIGYQEMILSGLISEPAEIESALRESLKQAKSMKDMIRDMLDLSALESGRNRPTQIIDLAQVASSCLKALTPQADRAKVRLVSSLASLEVKMNPQDAERLIRNLLDNAIKYNDEGGFVSISIDPGQRKLEIADTGIGMTEEELSHCFDRFYRTPESRGEGSGLGLAIVKHVCSYYGFTLDAQSVPKRGTTFTIQIPKVKKN